MRAIPLLVLAASVCCEPITSSSTILQTCDSGGGSLSAACAADVGRQYQRGKSSVRAVSRGTLNCAALDLYADMGEFEFDFNVRLLNKRRC
jgi:hypothetical protein